MAKNDFKIYLAREVNHIDYSWSRFFKDLVSDLVTDGFSSFSFPFTTFTFPLSFIIFSFHKNYPLATLFDEI